jgi:hypothetical protein
MDDWTAGFCVGGSAWQRTSRRLCEDAGKFSPAEVGSGSGTRMASLEDRAVIKAVSSANADLPIYIER